MPKLKKFLPLVTVLSLMGLFLNSYNRNHPFTALFTILTLSLFVGWLMMLIYYFVCSKFYNKENRLQIKFKHTFMIAIILVSVQYIIDTYGARENTDQSSSVETSHNSNAKIQDCPHCGGTGQRMNQITGTFGKCASCKGSGKVSQWQSDHYTNDNSPASDGQSDLLYTCPKCAGLGQQTDVSGDGMGQTSCDLCQGRGKVNQWTYENFAQ